MKVKVLALITVCLMLVSVIGLAFAAAEGNARKGKFLYRKNCRSCHGASASDLGPDSKTQAEWSLVFASPNTIPCHDQWPAEMTEQDRLDIEAYLIEFAKDSPTPAKCS
jgi:mono/diheme cytochrome c family protein